MYYESFIVNTKLKSIVDTQMIENKVRHCKKNHHLLRKDSKRERKEEEFWRAVNKMGIINP